MPEPTPTTDVKLPYNGGNFDTVAEALDYAARGERGYNFYSVRGELLRSLSYRELRERSIEVARRLVRAGLAPGARLVLAAETNPDFLFFFFGCQYAGLIPVPLAPPLNLGGREAYVDRLRRMVEKARASAVVAPAHLLGDLRKASLGLSIRLTGTPEDYYRLPSEGASLRPLGEDELCYIQYSSGSTRFPLGVSVSQRSLTSNAHGIIAHGLKARPGDRCASWLPLYHDMGLVGFCLAPLLAQLSVDYLTPTDFARRPLSWLKLISANGGTLAFSPTFGYDLCVRRGLRGPIDDLDLSCWRVAGIGGDMIRVEVLKRFAETFGRYGFRNPAFTASYGLAESTLAVSFGALEEEVEVDHVDKETYSRSGAAMREEGNEPSTRDVLSFVKCGRPLPGHGVAIRDEAGQALPERHVGKVYIQGPSVMSGYFGEPAATSRALSGDGWLDTGDMGYLVDGSLVITGRSKDLIIYNGRNIWPQDIEWTVERLSGLRPGDVAAFSVAGADGADKVVILVQYRPREPEARRRLEREIAEVVRAGVGVDCEVVPIPPRSLPVTSSGKVSRSEAKASYLSGFYAGPRLEDEAYAGSPTAEDPSVELPR